MLDADDVVEVDGIVEYEMEIDGFDSFVNASDFCGSDDVRLVLLT